MPSVTDLIRTLLMTGVANPERLSKADLERLYYSSPPAAGGSGADAAPATAHAADAEFGATSTALPSGWSQRNNAGAYNEDKSWGTIISTSKAATEVSALYRAKPVDATWTMIAKLAMTGLNSGINAFGLMTYDGGSDRMMYWLLNLDKTLTVTRWTNNTSLTDTPIASSQAWSSMPVWFKFQYASASIWNFGISHDGVTYRMTPYNHGGWSGITAVGIGSRNTSGGDQYIHMDYVRFLAGVV